MHPTALASDFPAVRHDPRLRARTQAKARALDRGP